MCVCGRFSQEKAAAAQSVALAKEAATKSAASQAAHATASAKEAAEGKADAEVAAKLAHAPALDHKVYAAVLDHIQQVTGATGVYVAVKDPGAGDDEEAKATLKYVGASTDHAFVLDKVVSEPKGATFAVWVRPPAPEEEEELDDEGNPKPKPPPPELPPLQIPNILRSDVAEFFRVPRLGAFLAVPFEFNSLSHPGAIPVPGALLALPGLCFLVFMVLMG